ncbi:T9SS type A sorting domain-containing protein [Owenweeksia hongkongensis]|uniref:T9SS type A sorting domain-containing protein n=1 Tax=Owenweeksia hongkongensis TaxID=253245 RepID=UPI003A8ED57C
MKKSATLLSICGILFSTFSYSQLAVDSIEINTLKAHIYADGGIWEMQTFDDSTYKNLLFADALWLAGMDTNTNTLHQSAQTYRQGTLDFSAGPISNDPNAPMKYNKVYKVNLQTLTDFKNGNTQGIPQEIADWPAHGDTTMGEDYNLAPFIDVNNDAEYVPGDGDYPKIKGDEAIYTIFNDVNGRTTGNSMGIEVHCLTYGYLTGGVEDSILYREYKVINRSNRDYTDAYLSIFADFDLGTPWDDLAGTAISANSVYTYNADGDDEGPIGFGQNLATCGMRMLQGPPAPLFDGLDNDKDGCIDGVRDANGNCVTESLNGVREQILLSGSMYFNNNSGNQGNPDTPLDYYNYMQSKWKNGNDLIIESPSGFGSVQNGDGFVANNIGTASRYYYPGNSFDTTGAYEPSSATNWFESPNNSADKRTLANAGPFNLNAGELFTIITAYIWSRNSNVDQGYGKINDLLENLGQNYENQPVRTVGLNAYKANQNYQLSFNTASAEWAITNDEDKNLSFELYTTTGQLITKFDVDSGSKITIPTEGFAKGVYLLVETKSGETHKVTK